MRWEPTNSDGGRTTASRSEEAERYPWAGSEASALVDAILGCLFGAELSLLDLPARAWARTNTTMAIFTRRLGCLRELVGEEGILNGPDSASRLQEIFDRVTIVATETALASLELSNPRPILEAQTPPAEPDGALSSDLAPTRRYRRRLVAALLAAGTAVVAVLLLVYAPGPAAHTGGPGPTRERQAPGTLVRSTGPSTKNGSTSTEGSGAQKPPRSGKPSDLSGSATPSTPDTVSGSSVTSEPGSGSGSAASQSGTGPSAASPGTGSSSESTTTTQPPTGGSPGIKLPGGTNVTVPTVTLPPVTIPPVSLGGLKL